MLILAILLLKGCKDYKVVKAIRVFKVIKVYKDVKAYKVDREQQAQLVHKEP